MCIFHLLPISQSEIRLKYCITLLFNSLNGEEFHVNVNIPTKKCPEKY